MKRKWILVAGAALLVSVMAMGLTLAFLRDQKQVTNTFTVGNVKITLTEPLWEQPETVEPGVAYAKDPTVTNVGANDAWIRVNVTVSDWAAFQTAAAAHGLTDLGAIFGGHDEALWTRAAIIENADDTVTYSYYYNTILAAGATTGALFTSVTVPALFTSEEMEALGNDFSITITADAIQASGFLTPADAFAAFDA